VIFTLSLYSTDSLGKGPADEIGSVTEGAVGVSMKVIHCPQGFVRAGRADFVSAFAQGMKEKGSSPAIHQLAIFVKRGVVIGEKAFVGGVLAVRKSAQSSFALKDGRRRISRGAVHSPSGAT